VPTVFTVPRPSTRQLRPNYLKLLGRESRGLAISPSQKRSPSTASRIVAKPSRDYYFSGNRAVDPSPRKMGITHFPTAASVFRDYFILGKRANDLLGNLATHVSAAQCVCVPCPVLRPLMASDGCPGKQPHAPHPVASHFEPQSSPALIASHPPHWSAIISCQAAHLARHWLLPA
jgi:hypothetical protein